MPTPKGGSGPRRSPAKLRAVLPHEHAPSVELPPPLEPPPHLPAEAQEVWRWICALDHVRSIVTIADVLLLEAIVTKVALRRRAVAELEARGGGTSYESATEGGGSIERPRPQASLIVALDRQLAGELGRLGLSPADRSRVSAALSAGKAFDPLDEFRLKR